MLLEAETLQSRGPKEYPSCRWAVIYGDDLRLFHTSPIKCKEILNSMVYKHRKNLVYLANTGKKIETALVEHLNELSGSNLSIRTERVEWEIRPYSAPSSFLPAKIQLITLDKVWLRQYWMAGFLANCLGYNTKDNFITNLGSNNPDRALGKTKVLTLIKNLKQFKRPVKMERGEYGFVYSMRNPNRAPLGTRKTFKRILKCAAHPAM